MYIPVKFDLGKFFKMFLFFLENFIHIYNQSKSYIPHPHTLIPPDALQPVPLTTSHPLLCLFVDHSLSLRRGASMSV